MGDDRGCLIIRCNKRVISCGLWREPLWNDSLLLKRIQRRTRGLFSQSKSIFPFSTHPSPPSTPTSTALYYIPDTYPIFFFFFVVRFFFSQPDCLSRSSQDCDYKCENTAQLGWKPFSLSEPVPTSCGRPGEVLLGNQIY